MFQPGRFTVMHSAFATASFRRPRRRIGAFFALVLALAVGPAPAAQADDRPVVRVDLRFEGALVQGRDLSAAQAAATAALAERAEARWGFAHWVPGDAAPADAAAWIMVVDVSISTLTTAAGTVPATKAMLEHRVRPPGGQETRVSLSELYPINRPIPLQAPDRLAADIVRHLDGELHVLLEIPAVERFLASVPIANRLIADADRAMLIVPVRRRDLRAESDSRLQVKFGHDAATEGDFEIEPAKEVAEPGEWAGYVVGHVVELRVHPLEIDTPFWWNAAFVEAVRDASDVRVYMTEYKPPRDGNLPTEAEIFTEPDR